MFLVRKTYKLNENGLFLSFFYIWLSVARSFPLPWFSFALFNCLEVLQTGTLSSCLFMIPFVVTVLLLFIAIYLLLHYCYILLRLLYCLFFFRSYKKEIKIYILFHYSYLSLGVRKMSYMYRRRCACFDAIRLNFHMTLYFYVLLCFVCCFVVSFPRLLCSVRFCI